MSNETAYIELVELEVQIDFLQNKKKPFLDEKEICQSYLQQSEFLFDACPCCGKPIPDKKEFRKQVMGKYTRLNIEIEKFNQQISDLRIQWSIIENRIHGKSD